MMTLSVLCASLANPPAEHAPIPFWFLNGDMNRTELERQLRLMHSVGIGTVVLHARQGHTVRYLSDEWFAGIRFCVETCAELGMTAWLYDEDNWPSGYAGGATLAAYPDGQAKHLAVVAQAGDGDEVVGTVGDRTFVMRPTPWHPAYNPGWYTDLLDLKATEAFIAATHERYAETLGEHMGTTVTAVFTDEPGFYNHFHDCAPGTIIWTRDMPEQFEQRCGYSLLPHLPVLFEDGPDAARVRRDFYRVVSDLIVERFYLPLKHWCNAHGTELVGHVNNEEYLVDHVRYNADFFSAMDGLDMPGMDVIGPAGDWHRQPDSFVAKITSSAAHTRGNVRSMSETYGAAGWGLTPEEIRRIADWLSVRGVTRIVPHAFYYSIAGDRYHECPPSLFFQSPHWPAITGLLRYMNRWSWLLENTQPAAQVAVYYPIDAVRSVTSPLVQRSLGGGLDEHSAGEAGRLGMAFRELTDGLFRAQIDYDILDDVALDAAELRDGALCLHGREYRALVVPEGGVSESARATVGKAERAGVAVISAGDGNAVDLAGQWRTVTLEPPCDQITVTRRSALDGDLLFVVNEGNAPYEGVLSIPGHYGVTVWDLGCGQVDGLACEAEHGHTRIAVQLLEGSAQCFGLAPQVR